MKILPTAKINLGLDILRKRPDGYHDLETVMVAVDWCDTLDIYETAGTADTLEVEGASFEGPSSDNLVMRAVKALREVAEFPPVSLLLVKQIPSGAGLGGGSADAAYTVTALNRLFSLGLTDKELEAVVAPLGADCPFFIKARPALCTGIGITMQQVFLPVLHALTVAVVKPPVSVSTREAYAGVIPNQPSEPLLDLLKRLPLDQWQGRVVNAFETSVFPRHPELAQIKEQLRAMGAVYASMSGSGSALYGLFDSETMTRLGGADILADHLRQRFPLCQCHVGSLRL